MRNGAGEGPRGRPRAAMLRGDRTARELCIMKLPLWINRRAARHRVTAGTCPGQVRPRAPNFHYVLVILAPRTEGRAGSGAETPHWRFRPRQVPSLHESVPIQWTDGRALCGSGAGRGVGFPLTKMRAQSRQHRSEAQGKARGTKCHVRASRTGVSPAPRSCDRERPWLPYANLVCHSGFGPATSPSTTA